MKKINAEIVKNIIATTIAFSTLLILALAIVLGSIKKNQELQGGDIKHAIETGQY
jgi:Ca2+/H+ antiporter